MSMEAAGAVAALGAGGTLARAEAITRPGQARRIRLLLEIGLLFILAPLAIQFAVHGLRQPLFFVLLPVLAGVILYLLWDETFRVRREFSRGIPLAELASVLALFAITGGAIAAFVQDVMPRDFLSFPTHRPQLWAMVMVLYPLMSVIVQELIYRTFFFHRYGPLFGERRWLAIVVNGAAFGFAHVIFGSYVSIILTTILGCLLAYRYERTRSFWLVWLEHSLYGCLIFTVGLGRYFFTGVSV